MADCSADGRTWKVWASWWERTLVGWRSFMLGLDEKDVFAYYLQLDELPCYCYSTRGVPLSSLLPHIVLALSMLLNSWLYWVPRLMSRFWLQVPTLVCLTLRYSPL
jgi:hypothetical protein